MAAASYIAMAISAAAAVYQAEQQSKAMNAQADQAKLNAIAARQQGAAAEEAQRRNNSQMLGLQRAAAAESGFDPNTGSLVTLQVKSAGEAELDALTARYEGTMQGLGLQQRATSLNAQARNTRTSGYVSAAGEVAKAAGKYYASQGGGSGN